MKMQLPVRLLDEKADNTPGDPVPLQNFIYLATCFISPSSDFTGTLTINMEMAENETGPWRSMGDIGNLTTGDAGKLLVASLGGFTSGHFVPWLRATLSASPTTGDVTVNAFALKFQP
jgi:hypothetical protein